MSKETITWLNENTYVGKLADRAFHAKNNWMIMDTKTGGMKPWWAPETGFLHGYEGFIPAEDIMAEGGLFGWEPLETTVRNQVKCDEAEADGIDGRGEFFRIVVDPKRKGIMHPTRDVIYGYFGIESYNVHSYKQWLIENVLTILKGGGGITSAGLLRDGGVAYATIEAPEGISVGGLDVRPMIVAGTSIDGTMATKYAISDYAAVCDNSFNSIMQSAASVLKIKHTSKSLGRVSGAQVALGLLDEHGEAIGKFIDSMMNIDVVDSEFHQLVKGLVPDVEPVMGTGKDAGKVTNQRAITIMEQKRGELMNLWKGDARVAKWTGTLFGAFQAANTWNQHFKSNNENAVERGMTGVLNGQYAKADGEFWQVVAGIETINTKSLVIVGGGK